MLLTDVWMLVDTHGVPLDVIVDYARSRGCIVDWRAFADAAVASGMNRRRVGAKIIEAVGDVYGPAGATAATAFVAAYLQ